MPCETASRIAGAQTLTLLRWSTRSDLLHALFRMSVRMQSTDGARCGSNEGIPQSRGRKHADRAQMITEAKQPGGASSKLCCALGLRNK